MNQHARVRLKPSPPSARAAPEVSVVASPVPKAHPTPAHPTPACETLGAHAGVTFQRERLAPILREIVPLIEADWRENGVDHDLIPLSLNLPAYLDYDLVGVLQIITARDAGVLVGYCFSFVHPHIMHAGRGWCILDLYWLYPEYRKQGIGNAMLDACETFLKSAKVQVVQASEKIGHAHGLFERRGYKATDTAYRKLLEV